MLSTEELILKINQLEENHRKLSIYSKQIGEELWELQKKYEYKIKLYETDILKSQIEEINFVDSFLFKDTKYDKYFVKLVNNNSYYYLHMQSNIKPPKVNDFISHRVEGSKIKEWHKLQ
jgi:Mor family transcriptional regulator